MNRKIDELGRLVIPKEMRKKLGLNERDEVKIELENDKIILTNPNKFNLEKYIEELLEDELYESYKDILNHLLWVMKENK